MKSLIRTVSLLTTVCIASPVNSATTAYDFEAKEPAEIAKMAIESYMRFGREEFEIYSKNYEIQGFGMRGISIGFVQAAGGGGTEEQFLAKDLQTTNLMTVPISATFPMLLGGCLGIAFFGRKRSKEAR